MVATRVGAFDVGRTERGPSAIRAGIPLLLLFAVVRAACVVVVRQIRIWAHTLYTCEHRRICARTTSGIYVKQCRVLQDSAL